jgi:hypothetical protein
LFGIEFNPVNQIRVDFVHKLHDSLVFHLFINSYGSKFKGELIAKQPLDEVHFGVDQSRCGDFLRPGAHVFPDSDQKLKIVDRSSSLCSSAAVRTITPPGKPSRCFRMMSFSRILSASEPIFRETPTCSTVGIYTR